MKPTPSSSFILLALLAFPFMLMPAGAQPMPYDSLIERSLRTFDLPPFEWEGAPEPLRPRLGIYMRRVADDAAAKLPGYYTGMRAFEIWHVMPHWSADEAGVYTGDILTAVNGAAIVDTLYGPDDLVNRMARAMPPGGTLRLTIVRGGAVREIAVPLRTAAYAPAPLPAAPSALGPIRAGSWLQHSLRDHALAKRSGTIQKQLRVIADQDFSTVPFTDRPSPWRLGAITYLHRNPTRVGAYSRWLDEALWMEKSKGPGLRGAVDAAALDLDIAPVEGGDRPLPESVTAMKLYLADVQQLLDVAYRPVKGELDSMTRALASLLDMNDNWEERYDTVSDPVAKRAIRIDLENRIASLFGRADRVDRGSLVLAARMLAALADSSWLVSRAGELEGLKETNGVALDGIDGDVIHAWDSPMGRCVIGGSGANRYRGRFALLIDLGGDDVYELDQATPGSLRFVGDIAGNDYYGGGAIAQGAGVGTVDVLADLRGNDVYRAERFSQGAGLLGVGILADYDGSDIYDARWCSQGAGLLGIGILYDGAGSDSYTAEVYSQGFAYVRGFGAIMENGGNDSYRAGWKYPDSRIPGRAHLAMSQGFAYGMRPWSVGIGADGGIGILSDRRGHDLYASDFFSQGGSYWYALGILHDVEGCDRYTAGQYSQGSGIHLSFGALLDDSGDDIYDAYAGLEQGNAHDWSAGCLEDWSGNDIYRGSSSSQGSALNVSFAWLIDGGGNDNYYALGTDTLHSQGGGNYNIVREEGGIGMLLDLGSGVDYYTEPRVVSGRPVVKGFGVVYDDGPEGK